MRERGAGPAFMLVPECPRGGTAFAHESVLQEAALACQRLASNEVGCVFLPATLPCHALLLRTCPSGPGGSF